MKKKLLVLAVIIISLIAIGAVASQDNVSDQVTASDDSQDNQPVAASDDNTVKKSSDTNDDKVKDSVQEYVNITVTKIWKGDENNSTRPNGVDVVLLANGEKVADAHITKKDAVEDNTWVYKFENLPKYDEDHNPIQYDIKELNVSSYTSEIMKNSDYEFRIINTLGDPKQPDSPGSSGDNTDDSSNGTDNPEKDVTPTNKDTKKNTTTHTTKQTKTKQVTRTTDKNTGNPLMALALASIVAVFVPLRRR